MTPPKCHIARALVLVLALAAWVPGIAPADQHGLPEETGYPQVEADVDPADLHTPALGGETGSVPPAEVNLEALQPSVADVEVAGPQTHLQGEYTDFGPLDFGERAAAFAEAPDPTPSEEPEGADAAAAPGQNVGSFQGRNFTGWFPPDTVLAVGPSHILEAVNSGFIVYNKSGSVAKSYTTFSSFFAPVKPSPWSGSHFDPRVLYSQQWGKYVMLALGRDTNAQNSYIFLAISKTNSATGSWWLWRFQADWGSHSDAWLDYAGLGADKWGVYFTGNYFFWAGGFKYAMIWSINPAVFSGGASNGWQFWDLRWPSGSKAFALQPALPHSNNSNQQTFFANTFSGSGNQLLLWKLGGSRTNSPSLSKHVVGINSYDAIGSTIVQKGTPTDLNGGDARIMNAVYSQHRVFTTLATDPPKNGTASGFLVNRINTDTNAAEWQSLVWSGTGQYYFYPALTIAGGSSTKPNVGVYVNWSNANRFASAAYRLWDGNGAVLKWVLIKSGEASYVRLDNSGRNRWGDYSGAAYDWSQSTPTMWGAVEYAGTSNQWKTWIKGVTMQ